MHDAVDPERADLDADREAEAGGLGVPDMTVAVSVLEALASGCLSTAFLWIQHHGPVLAAAYCEVPGIRGFYLDVGWGTYGFKAGPVSGRRMAELIATGRTPELIQAFSITRFAEDRLVGEKAAAAVSH